MKRMRSYIPLYLSYQQGLGLSESTLKRSTYYLKRFAAWLGEIDIREVNFDTFLSYREYLAGVKNVKGEAVKQVTIEHHVLELKGFFTYLYRSDLLLTNPAEDLPGKTSGKGISYVLFSEEDISLFLDVIPVKTPVGQRDRALFELMYSSGLRGGEARGLLKDQINLDERVCLVTGKGNRQRYVPFSNTASRFLLKYVGEGRKALVRRFSREEIRRYLFLSSVGQMSWKVMRTRFQRYVGACGLKGKGYTMHSIRHATATHLLAHGASIRYVQELLGHRSLKTTQIYTRPTEENIKSVYRTYHPRENEYYREVDTEYLTELSKLKTRIMFGKKVHEQYRKQGNKRGFDWGGKV